MTTVVPAAPGAPARVTPAPERPKVRATPEVLRAGLALVGVLALVCAVLGGITAERAAGAARTLDTRTVPAELAAATAYTSIQDADTTAAEAFLAGGLEPVASRQRYLADLDAAGRALATAAGYADDARASADVAEVTRQLPVYAGYVEQARANNRQGFPVGAAYLSTASTLAQGTLLPKADDLLTDEQARVADGYSAARSTLTVVLLVLALLLSLAALLGLQLQITRRTNRLVNPPLALATLLGLVTLVATVSIVVSAHSQLSSADKNGSGQIALVARAQIAALQERGDESLTLIGRGDDDHEPQFTAAAADFTARIKELEANQPSDQAQLLGAADTAELDYLALHKQVTTAFAASDFATSDTAQAAGAAPFATLTDSLAKLSDDDRATFAEHAHKPSGPLTALAVLVPLLALLGLAAAWSGVRLRLREYE